MKQNEAQLVLRQQNESEGAAAAALLACLESEYLRVMLWSPVYDEWVDVKVLDVLVIGRKLSLCVESYKPKAFRTYPMRKAGVLDVSHKQLQVDFRTRNFRRVNDRALYIFEPDLEEIT